ncbi:MAG TPA: hypothetical protein DEF00_01605 [Candidatus Taylorbacteria bacterium]|nr:hypothetical protein [Candidatus Taylorbacteria bacterium]
MVDYRCKKQKRTVSFLLSTYYYLLTLCAMVFEIKQEKFEGPLDLLLTLIEQKKLHINDITLSSVTDDFLNYAKSSTDFPIAESAEFAFVAATLLLIKSKALLPQLSLSNEEAENIDELQNRLRLLQRFRRLGRNIRELYGSARLYLPLPREIEPVFAPPSKMVSSIILTAIKSVLAAIPKTEALSKVAITKVISLEYMIENLKNRISSALRMSFKEFAGAHKGARVNIIVGFLAMLELVKDGIITASQDRPNGNIMMETGRVDIPRY